MAPLEATVPPPGGKPRPPQVPLGLNVVRPTRNEATPTKEATPARKRDHAPVE